MRTRMVGTGLLLAFLALFTFNAESQIVKKAQVGFRFLENPVSAEVVGRGMIGVTTTLSANSVFWNPGELGWQTSTVDLEMNHTQGIADINYNAAAAGVRVGNFGVIGFSLLTMDYGTFYGTRLAPNDQGYIETGTFSPSAYAVGVAFSQKISDRFSYGVHVKYVNQNLGDAYVAPTGSSLTDPNLAISTRQYAQNALAMDVGAYYDFLYNGIRFGACMQNISREIRYENEAFPMPFAISFGATVEPFKFFMDNPTDEFILSFESRHPRDFNEKLKMGAEYHFFNTFIARVGYATNYDERGLSAGIGVRYTLGDFPLRVDYAYQAFGIFGAVHYISLGVNY
ncbi:MAG TPA: PorV/PorQ family protein [Bacteroidota bacterium]|nr:PorV/PorQ family protein [Bacteroidota bacterium]